MSARVAAIVAWSLWVLSVAFAVFGVLFLYLNGSFEHVLDESLGVDMVMAVAFPAVGAIIASRQAQNAVGWIFCAIGLSGGASIFFSEYGIFALVTQPGSLPVGVIAAWIGTWVWLPSLILMGTLLLLLFPDGRLPSRRWRPVAWTAVSLAVASTAILATAPWDLLEAGVPAENPFEVESLRDAGIAVPVPILLVGIPTMLLSVASLVIRFRRSRGGERQQLKWFVYAGVLNVGVLLSPGSDASNAVSLLQIATFPLLPIAAGIAILRYRLYDIDRIINSTLVYGLLTAMLVFVYVGSVFSLQYVLRTMTGETSQLVVVVSTLAIAALFNPLRRRFQSFIDRRFYRKKYDAQKTLAAFSARLREETDLETLGGDLVGVARNTVQPEHVSLWLKSSERRPGDRNGRT